MNELEQYGAIVSAITYIALARARLSMEMTLAGSLEALNTLDSAVSHLRNQLPHALRWATYRIESAAVNAIFEARSHLRSTL